MTGLSTRMSEVVRSLRFPLMIIVVFIHLPQAGDYALPLPDLWYTTGAGWYYYLAKIISFTIGHAAVPSFFLFSGYYLFAKPRTWWSAGVYQTEMRKRSRTLLYPYVVWCTIPLLLSLLLGLVGVSGGDSVHALLTDPLGSLTSAYLTGPINFPLWYVRELILLSLLAPLIDLIIRRLPWLLILLYLLYFVGWGLPLISATSIFYFTLGGWLGSRHIDVAALGDRVRVWLLPLVGLFTLAMPFAFGSVYHPRLVCLYVPLAVLGFFSLGGWLRDHAPRWHRLALRAEASVFFVYVVHEVLILSSVKGLLFRLGWLETIPGYLLGGALVYGISYLIYEVLRRWMPRLLHLLIGSRA